MPLNERFLPRRNPQVPGEKGTPFALSNGLGRYFVVRQAMNEVGRTTTVANLAFADTRGQYVRPQRERNNDRNP